MAPLPSHIPDDPLARPHPKARNIVLIGFMATGKTTIGKIAAKKSGFSFIDTDREIERIAGKPISAIFAEKGEAAFREIESSVLRDLAGRDNCVISTGGGIVTRPENHHLLQELGFVVWLHTKKKIIFDRVMRNPHRPLLQTADPFATIRNLVEERKPLYKAVMDQKVKTTHLSPAEAVTGILESAMWFFSEHFPQGKKEVASGDQEGEV